jgi:hypothetical protein
MFKGLRRAWNTAAWALNDFIYGAPEEAEEPNTYTLTALPEWFVNCPDGTELDDNQLDQVTGGYPYSGPLVLVDEAGVQVSETDYPKGVDLTSGTVVAGATFTVDADTNSLAGLESNTDTIPDGAELTDEQLALVTAQPSVQPVYRPQ